MNKESAIIRRTGSNIEEKPRPPFRLKSLEFKLQEGIGAIPDTFVSTPSLPSGLHLQVRLSVDGRRPIGAELHFDTPGKPEISKWESTRLTHHITLISGIGKRRLGVSETYARQETTELTGDIGVAPADPQHHDLVNLANHVMAAKFTLTPGHTPQQTTAFNIIAAIMKRHYRQPFERIPTQ